MSQFPLFSSAIFEIFSTAANTRILKSSDYLGLLEISLKDNLEEEERRIIERILHAVRRGKITLIA